jgi:hypothetical protein
MADDPFEVVDSSGLTDADWAEINKLQQAYKEGGKAALNRAMAALAKDPIRFTAVIGAFFPQMIREGIRDAVAEAGLTEEDLREMARNLDSSRPIARRRRAVAAPVRYSRSGLVWCRPIERPSRPALEWPAWPAILTSARSSPKSDRPLGRSPRTISSGIHIARPYSSCSLGNLLRSGLLHRPHVQIQHALALVALFLVLLPKLDDLF